MAQGYFSIAVCCTGTCPRFAECFPLEYRLEFNPNPVMIRKDDGEDVCDTCFEDLFIDQPCLESLNDVFARIKKAIKQRFYYTVEAVCENPICNFKGEKVWIDFYQIGKSIRRATANVETGTNKCQCCEIPLAISYPVTNVPKKSKSHFI